MVMVTCVGSTSVSGEAGGPGTARWASRSAWLAQRWSDPAFPAAFPWFNTQRYWQDRILELREQVAAMSEPAIEVP